MVLLQQTSDPRCEEVRHPLVTNHDRGKALARLDFVGDEALLQAVTDRLIKAKKLVGDARRIARADFKPKLSANQRKLKDKIVEEHKKAGDLKRAWDSSTSDSIPSSRSRW